MKTKAMLTIAVTTIALIQSVLAKPALPEFKSREEVHAIRAEQMAGKETLFQNKRAQVRTANFFTGKPYLEIIEEYAFLFRSYDPGIGRWSSSDPIGFPDGANNHWYAPSPIFDVDPTGAYSLGGVTTPNPSSLPNSNGTLYATGWQAAKDSKSASSVFGSIGGGFPNYTFSFPGVELDGSVNLLHYKVQSETGGARAPIQMQYSGSVPSGAQFVWLQAAYKDTPNHSWNYIPDNGGASSPWISNTTVLNDAPGLPWISGSKFTAYSFLSIKTGSDIAIYDNPILWGFEVYE